jgi:hypothetical protein
MFPIMAGLGLGEFLLVVESLDGGRRDWLLLASLAIPAVVPLVVWFLLWGRSVRWGGWRSILAVIVIGAVAVAILAAFTLGASRRIYVVPLLMISSSVLSVGGVATLTFCCWSPPPDRCPGAVVCPECRYDLHMQQICRCPECGAQFNVEELIAPEERPLPIGLHAR